MLQQQQARDYVIATGQQHTIEDLLSVAFAHVGIVDWQQYVKTDPRFKRPAELHSLCGNVSSAKEILGWQPRTDFKTMIGLMVDADLARLDKR
jgi:GDPmannose 4,6-dehydratase